MTDINKNPVVFGSTTFQDLLEQIHTNSTDKRTEINTLMKSLLGLVGGSPQNAAIIAPLLKELLEVAVKNDDANIKIATLIQRMMSSEIQATGGNRESAILSDAERSQLIAEAEKDAVSELTYAVSAADELRELKKKIGQVTSGSAK